MPRGRPVGPEKRAEVLRLHGEGLGRNEIAARSGVSSASVTKIVADAGLSFDRVATAVATAARRVDLAAMRADLNEHALRKAKDFLVALDRPFLAFNFGGKDNTYEEHLLDSPPTGDIKNLMTAFGIAVQRSIELEKVDSDRGVGDAVSVLDSLADALKSAADVLDGS